ncbi:MAG TPA: membrane dipeptidase [Polyangiaceae bacterium]|nr:membrane dipeptidase [Polyangiaceae bacterium]
MRFTGAHLVKSAPRAWVVAGVLASSLLALAPRLSAEVAPEPVVDLHVDLPYRSGYKGKPFADGSGEFRARDLVAAGVYGVVLPLFVPKDATPTGRTQGEFEASYQRVFRGIVETPPYAAPGCGVGRVAGEARAVTTWLSFEGAEPLEATRESLWPWTLRGARLFALVHSEHNRFAESSGQPSTGKGLTDLGRRFAEAVLDVGGVLDVSHASDESTDQLIELARARGRAIVASHSNARALAAHPRNLTDGQIRAIARSGGVVGVNFHSNFLRPGGATAELGDVVKQIQHLVRVGGLGVVAVGSDFEGGIRPAQGLENASRYRALARALGKAGYGRADRERMLAGNALRVLCGPANSGTSGTP